MSRTMWMKKLIGGTANLAQAILYSPTGRAQTNVKAELDRHNTALTELTDDTGWQELTSNIAYRKKGGVVYLTIFSGVTTTSTWSLLATLPSGYAPVANTTFTLYCNFTNNQFGNILIDSSGNIYGLGNANVQNATISYIPA